MAERGTVERPISKPKRAANLIAVPEPDNFAERRAQRDEGEQREGHEAQRRDLERGVRHERAA